MTEEPYRWLEAIGNRREYVEGQLKGGSPVFALSLASGILLLGVGTGQSKVFEIFDRHGLAGLGHPADLERIRQSMIDAAHLEAFTRAAADVSLRRLTSYLLSPQLKTAFELVFSPPFLIRLVLAELADEPRGDVLVRVDFDGTFALQNGGVAVVADAQNPAEEAGRWLSARITPETSIPAAAALALDAWRHLTSGQPLPPDPTETASLFAAFSDRVIEAALLDRTMTTPARYRPLDRKQLGIPDSRTP